MLWLRAWVRSRSRSPHELAINGAWVMLHLLCGWLVFVLFSSEVRAPRPHRDDAQCSRLSVQRNPPPPQPPLSPWKTLAALVKNGNWSRAWLDLVAEDPTVRFTHAEYLPQSSEVRCHGPRFFYWKP